MFLRAVYFDHFLEQDDLRLLISTLPLSSLLKQRIDTLKFIQDRNRRAFGYYLISNIIHELTGYHKEWYLNDKGKPLYDGIAFNVSHDSRFVVLVAQKDALSVIKLGVDVVCISHDTDFMEFTDYLTGKESDWINSLGNKGLGFFMIWALKEATTKGIGDGMGLDFKRLEFLIKKDSRDHVTEIMGFLDGQRMDWDFSIQFIDKEHVVAIASNHSFDRKEFDIQNASLVFGKISAQKMISQEFQVKKVSNKEEWELAYEIRVNVFVHEQKVPQENELDELDPECVHWIVLTGDGKAVGTLRLYVDPLGRKGKLGRMAVLKEYRRQGIGKMLIQELVEYAQNCTDIQKIVCHSQEYIQEFYKSCGFQVESPDIFMEEGIPHVLMTRLIR